MPDLRRRPGISAEELCAAVRVHADRVHDFVRRLGCDPAAAVEVVQQSALDLVAAAATAPEQVGDLVGWWFRRARALARRVAGDESELPLGGGLLSADDDQELIALALVELPERERVALLLRDSYTLPATSVGVALGTDAAGSMETVGGARLAFLAAVGDAPGRSTAGHELALASLARLGEGGPVAAADATPRRHAQSCPICREVWDAQTRAHLLLAGLTVAALPEPERDNVLGSIDAQARGQLPAASALLIADGGDEVNERPSRWLLPFYALLALLAAAVIGTILGVVLSRGGSSASPGPAPSQVDPGASTQPTASPVPSTVPSAPPPTAQQPPPRVFLITPTPSPTPSPPPSTPPPVATEPLTLSLNPTSGPNGAPVTVQGTGWIPGATVTIDYLDPLGRQTGSHAVATVDARGRFTTTLAAQDPTNLPGRHTVRASDGTQTMSARYDVTG